MPAAAAAARRGAAGLALPFGVMIAKLKRNQMMQEIMNVGLGFGFRVEV